MKIAIITDTHYGARKGSKHIHDYFELFYKNVFFPSLEEHNIDTVIHMGDIFDSRKAIDLQRLEWAKKVVFEPLKKYKVHAIIGNHDCYYKDTNYVNSPELLLNNYSNITTYSELAEINIDGLGILLIPWINSQNYDNAKNVIQNCKSKIAMGHLEMNGFQATRGHVMENGMEVNVFDNFTRVYSGHFHTRSNDGKIYYLGNPYEIYWNDYNDKKGFHIFDTETLELERIVNPFRLHDKIYYDDSQEDYDKHDVKKYLKKYVKVIVVNKKDLYKFDMFMERLLKANAHEVKIVENFTDAGADNVSDDIVKYAEDTTTLLDKYIDELEIDLDKDRLKNTMRGLYNEAQDLEI